MATEQLTFEQPLNENIRMCLRLEHLFQQVNYHVDGKSPWDSRATLDAILDTLNVIDRPDLKNKLSQILHQYSASLGNLEKSPGVDKAKLNKTLQQISNLITAFHSSKGKIAQPLRENEFLALINQRANTPAGTCGFNLAPYHLWLEQTAEIRIKSLKTWAEPFDLVQEAVSLILKITRDSTNFKPNTAIAGFYQETLDTTLAYQMIRIRTSKKEKIYPEISVGRHRLSIHFFDLNQDGHSHQAKQDVSFELALCKL